MRLIFLISIMLFTSCSPQKIESFEEMTPELTLEKYFIGKVEGTGVFFDRFSNLKRSFIVKMEGHLENDILIFKENLTYDNGEVVTRDYKIKKYSKNAYRAEATDMVGLAEIQSYGNALQWRYRLKQKIGKSDWVLSFDDWMYLQPNGIIINKATVTKFGIKVGEVFMSIKRLE